MAITLSIIALTISICAFIFSVIKFIRTDHLSKFIQHRNSLILIKDTLKSSVALRERVRVIDSDHYLGVLEESFAEIEALTENISEVANKISRFDPTKSPLSQLHLLETKIHTLAIEVVSWESIIEGVAGFEGKQPPVSNETNIKV